MHAWIGQRTTSILTSLLLLISFQSDPKKKKNVVLKCSDEARVFSKKIVTLIRQLAGHVGGVKIISYGNVRLVNVPCTLVP